MLLARNCLRDFYVCRLLDTNEMGGHVARMVEGRGVHRVLVGKPERKRPLGRTRLRSEDNIKMDLHGRGLWGLDGVGSG